MQNSGHFLVVIICKLTVNKSYLKFNVSFYKVYIKFVCTNHANSLLMSEAFMKVAGILT